jgi:hypothetical protein
MAQTTIGFNEIVQLVQGLSDKHVLKSRPKEYIAGFANAALSAYKNEELLDKLQRKFSIPDDTRFTEDTYLQSASELTVASYVRGRGVSEFDTEKKVNQPNSNKDVDVYYRIGSTRICLEVKCPFEEPVVSSVPYRVLPAGHTPGGLERVRNFVQTANTQRANTFQEGKNREMRLKDALVDAHQKFPQNPGMDELNLLFLACGDFIRMSEWHGNLMGAGGFFAGDSFHPPSTYRNVDFVILSNLKYRHSVSFSSPAWSLDDVLLIPVANPHGRTNLFDATREEGLSIFSHYRKEFLSERIVRAGVEEIQASADPHTKVTWFVDRHLSLSEKRRFFPVCPPQSPLTPW